MALKTMDIKGKKYVPVNVRIQEFRANAKYTDWALTSEIYKLDHEVCVIRASITDIDGRLVAQGIAQETFDARTNPKYVENCETSAWGRALGSLGIGINESIASADEMTSFTNNSLLYNAQQVSKEASRAPVQNGDASCSHENTTFKEGISKNGKPYQMNKCTDCGNIEWIN